GPDRTATERDAVGELARLCARLPLALNVAAARAAGRPGATLAGVAGGVRDAGNPLDALSTGDAATDPRAVFSWSYRLPAPATARLFRLLGLHPGPETPVGAAASLASVPAARVREMLATLVAAHLLTGPAPGRYGFHDLLRAYALDRVHAEEAPADRDAAR